MTPTHPLRPVWLQLRPWREHSLVVSLAGAIYVVYGVFIWAQQTPERHQQLMVLTRLSHGVFWPWCLLWIIVGGLAVVSSRWPVMSQTWGYAVMQALAACWALAYLTGYLFLGVSSANLGGAIVWGLLVVMWYAIARLVNPSDIAQPPAPASTDPGG